MCELLLSDLIICSIFEKYLYAAVIGTLFVIFTFLFADATKTFFVKSLSRLFLLEIQLG